MKLKVAGYSSLIGVESYTVYAPVARAAIQKVKTVADVNGNLDGTYFHIWNALNTMRYVVWYSIGSFQVTDITTTADTAGSLNNKWFHLYSALDGRHFYVWYNVSGTGVDPVPNSNWSGISVAIATNALSTAVASATQAAINATNEFDATVLSSVVTVTNTRKGAATPASNGTTTGFTFNVTTPGTGKGSIAPNDFYNQTVGVDYTLVTVNGALNATANTLATATQTAIDPLADFVATVLTNEVTITNAANGDTFAAIDSTLKPTGFTFNLTQTGLLALPAGTNMFRIVGRIPDQRYIQQGNFNGPVEGAVTKIDIIVHEHQVTAIFE